MNKYILLAVLLGPWLLILLGPWLINRQYFLHDASQNKPPPPSNLVIQDITELSDHKVKIVTFLDIKNNDICHLAYGQFSGSGVSISCLHMENK